MFHTSWSMNESVSPEIKLNKMVLRQTDQPVWPGPAYVPKVGPAPAAGHTLNISQKLTYDVVIQAPYSQHSHHKSQTFVVQKGYAIEQHCIVEGPELLPAPQHVPQDTAQQPIYTQNAKPAVNMSRTPNTKWIENDGKASS